MELKPNSVHELLELHDRKFLESSYQTLFGRPLDQAGAHAYLPILRDGHDRENVLYVLATCEEAARFRSDLAGLPQFLRLQRRLRAPPFAILIRILYRFRRHRLQTNRIETQLCRLEDRIAALETTLTQSASEVDKAAASRELQNLIDNIKSPFARSIFCRLNVSVKTQEI